MAIRNQLCYSRKMFLRALTTISGFTLLSRILGFVRDLLMAAAIGAGPLADAFLVALKLPNLFRRMFADGAFSAAFVPIFSKELTQDQQAARIFAGRAMSVLTLVLCCLVVLFEIGMPYVVRVLAPGFEVGSEQQLAAVNLSRITFPFLLLIALVALLTGVLNSVGRYAYGAISPIFMNLILIAALLLPYTGYAQVKALAWAVTLSGAVQLVFMLTGAKRQQAMPIISKPTLSPNIKRLFKLMGPGMLGAGVYQLNVTVDVLLASLLPAGSISWLYYADRLAQLPLGVIGVAMGSALLPIIAKHLQKGEQDKALAVQQQALQAGVFFAIPAMVGLALLAEPIYSVLFERGEFTAIDTFNTSRTLQAFALALPATILGKVLLATFFALEDTKTPVKIAAIAVVVNIGFSLWLMHLFGCIGIALATAISAWVTFLLMALILRRRGVLLFKNVPVFALQIIIATVTMAGAIILLDKLAPVNEATYLALSVIGGGAVFLAMVRLSGIGSMTNLKRLFTRPAV